MVAGHEKLEKPCVSHVTSHVVCRRRLSVSVITQAASLLPPPRRSGAAAARFVFNGHRAYLLERGPSVAVPGAMGAS